VPAGAAGRTRPGRVVTWFRRPVRLLMSGAVRNWYADACLVSCRSAPRGRYKAPLAEAAAEFFVAGQARRAGGGLRPAFGAVAKGKPTPCVVVIVATSPGMHVRPTRRTLDIPIRRPGRK
jgi:hypothetical protein